MSTTNSQSPFHQFDRLLVSHVGQFLDPLSRHRWVKSCCRGRQQCCCVTLEWLIRSTTRKSALRGAEVTSAITTSAAPSAKISFISKLILGNPNVDPWPVLITEMCKWIKSDNKEYATALSELLLHMVGTAYEFMFYQVRPSKVDPTCLLEHLVASTSIGFDHLPPHDELFDVTNFDYRLRREFLTTYEAVDDVRRRCIGQKKAKYHINLHDEVDERARNDPEWFRDTLAREAKQMLRYTAFKATKQRITSHIQNTGARDGIILYPAEHSFILDASHTDEEFDQFVNGSTGNDDDEDRIVHDFDDDGIPYLLDVEEFLDQEYQAHQSRIARVCGELCSPSFSYETSGITDPHPSRLSKKGFHDFLLKSGIFKRKTMCSPSVVKFLHQIMEDVHFGTILETQLATSKSTVDDDKAPSLASSCSWTYSLLIGEVNGSTVRMARITDPLEDNDDDENDDSDYEDEEAEEDSSRKRKFGADGDDGRSLRRSRRDETREAFGRSQIVDLSD